MDNDRKSDDRDLTEVDRIVTGLYEKGRAPIPWDESDEAILALSREVLRARTEMGGRDRTKDDSDLTESDRVVMGLYEKGRAPIPWDESDDAILALSRETRGSGRQGSDSGGGGAAEGDNVVSLADRRKSLVSRVIHSPATGFAMAASLLVGIFVGQGLPPVWEFGSPPGQQGEPAELTRGIGVKQITQPAPAQTPAAAPVTLSSDTLEALGQATSGYKCAELESRIAHNSRITVTGFVSSPADLRALGETLHRMKGVQVVNEAEVVEWPSCEALQMLYRMGGAALSTERLPVVRPHDHGSQYLENENLVVEASATTHFDGYLYVDMITHDGQVLHMLWTMDQVGARAAAGQRFMLGTQGQVFTIVPPFGTEMMMVISSPVPLIEGPRPQIEPIDAYLEKLKAGMESARTSSSRQVVSNYHFIRTGPSSGSQGRP